MHDGARMLILGGARAGKSTFALQHAREQETACGGPVCFIATAEASDEEMRFRIDRHRTERPADWRTIEEPRHLDIALQQASEAKIVIVDCLTLCVSNWLLAGEDYETTEQNIDGLMDRMTTVMNAGRQTIIMVSNEVGLGLVPDNVLGRSFRDLLGRVNQHMAQAASHVYLMVAGLPLELKPNTRSTQ